MDFRQALNKAQIAAVTAPAGPVLVLAGPGSGKTRVLTYRVAYLIQELAVPPWQIMAVTFTNKAAREMNQRVHDLLEGRPQGLTMGTFHAICARILRREVDSLENYDRDFVIFDTADQLQAVKQALKDLDLDDKKFRPTRILNGISNAKNELITAAMYMATNYIAEVTRRVYARYQEILHANNAMDFDDLLMNTVLLFDARPDVLARYQQRYQQILVDEFQDTNTSQYGLLQRLAAGHGNIFVVGDSDQSIYKWRGADFRNIQRFRQAYPEARQFLLEQNYRSTQLILDVAKAVISHNPNRTHKELFTERQGGERVILREAYNETEEAESVIATIEHLMLDAYAAGDVAVMFRTNAQSRVLEEAFLREGLPYRLVGATAFYQRREVKDLIAYLRLVHNPADSVSLARVLNTPTRGIGQKSRQALFNWAAANGWAPAEALLRLATDSDLAPPFSPRATKALARFGRMLHAWTVVRDEADVGTLLDLILEQSGYQAYIDDGTPDGRERWENVMELRSVAAADRAVPLGDLLEQLALVTDTDNLEDAPDAPTLLTLHSAKGLEFPIVFITGLEDGMLPHSRSLDDGEELAEERRLFYVGLTRAKDRVFLSHAFRRTYFGEASVSQPSRFLYDIPAELLDADSAGMRRRQSVVRASTWDNAAASWDRRGASYSRPAPANDDENEAGRLPPPRHLQPDPDAGRQHQAAAAAAYRTGQTVRHARFGRGTVIESKVTGDDEEVTVAFPDVGIKRLAASFANLEIVSG